MSDNFFTDLSSNNAGFNAAKYASSGRWVVALKATEGTGFVNPDYAGWVRDAHRHGLCVIHYHFAHPENGAPEAEAEFFWAHVREHFIRPGDYVVVDVETGNPEQAREWVQRFDNALHRISGTHPILYSYLSYLEEGSFTNENRYVWIAAYNASRPGNFRWRLGELSIFAWQYTDGTGHGPPKYPQTAAGVPGTCDNSVLNPTVAKQIRKSRDERRTHR